MDLPCCQPAREGGAHSLFDRMKRNIYARALVRSCARAWQAHRQLARARGDFIAWKRFGRCPHPHPHGPRLRVRLQKAFSIVSPCRAVPRRAAPRLARTQPRTCCWRVVNCFAKTTPRPVIFLSLPFSSYTHTSAFDLRLEKRCMFYNSTENFFFVNLR